MPGIPVIFTGESAGGVGAARAVGTAIETAAEQVKAANAAMSEAAKIATGDLRLTADAAEASAAARVKSSKLTIDAMRGEITAIEAVMTSYKRGTEEWKIAATQRIEIERKVQAALGETAKVARASAASSARSGEAGAAERGALRGGIGGRAIGFGSNAFLGGLLAAGGIKAAIDSVKQFQVSMGQLRLAVIDSGKSWTQYRGELQQTTDRMEKLGFSGNDVRAGLAALVRANRGDVAKSLQEMSAAADLARARNISLGSAVQILNRLNVGNATSLRRLGIDVRQVTTHMDAFRAAHIKVTDANRAQVIQLQHHAAQLDKDATRTEALRKIQIAYGNAAEQYSHTAAGAQDRMRVAIEKLSIAAGRALLPSITNVANAVSKWADNEKNVTEVTHVLHDALGALHEAFKVVKEIIHLADGVTGSFKNTVEVLIGLKVAKWAIASAEAIMTKLVPAEAAAGDAAVVATGEVGGLRGALMSLGSARVLGPIAVVAAALYGLKKLHDAVAGGALGGPGGSTQQGQTYAVSGGYVYQGLNNKWYYHSDTGGYRGQGTDRPITAAQAASMSGGATRTAGAASQPQGTTLGQDAASRRGANQKLRWSGKYSGLDAGFARKLEACVTDAGGTAIQVDSGRRSEAENKRVKGASNSNHLTGHAADGKCLIRGRWYPLGQAPMNYAKHGLRAGATFDWGGGPDIYHVDDGTNVGGATTTQTWDQQLAAARAAGAAGTTASKRFALPQRMQQQLATARGTTSTADDIAAETAGINYINQQLPHLTGARRTQALTLRSSLENARRRAEHHAGGGSQGLSLEMPTGLNPEQRKVAMIIYRTAIANGASPEAALAMVAGAYLESGLDPKAAGGGLFQILSVNHNYKRYMALLASGKYDAATAATMAMVGDYITAERDHPNATADVVAGYAEHPAYSVAHPNDPYGNQGAAKLRTARGFRLTGGPGGAPAGPRMASVTSEISLGANVAAAIKKADAAIATAQAQISTALEQLGPSFGEAANLSIDSALTATIANAEKHLRALRAKLSKPMTAKELAETRASIRSWETVLNTSVASAGKKAAAAAQVAATVRQQAYDNVMTQAQRSFDKQTHDYERAFNRATDAYVKNFEKQTQRVSDAMQVTVQGSGFGAFQFGGAITQTPAEAELQRRQDARAERDRQDAIQQAQQALRDAQAGGDPATIVKAQRDLNDALEAEDSAHLEQQAKLERDAADKQLQQAKDAYQEQRQNQLDAYQQQRQDQLDAYDTMRGDSWNKMQQQLALNQVLYDTGVEQWSDYVVNLKNALQAVGVEIPDAVIQDLLAKGAGPGKYAGSAAKDVKKQLTAPQDSGGTGGTPTVGGVGYQTGGFATRPQVVQVAEHEPEAILPWSWMPPSLQGALTTIMRTRGVPGHERIPQVPIRHAAGGAFILPDGQFVRRAPTAATSGSTVDYSHLPQEDQPASWGGGGGGGGGGGSSSSAPSVRDPVQVAATAAATAAATITPALVAAVTQATADRPTAVNVVVNVAGSVQRERDLAISVRDQLVAYARQSGVKIFRGYA